MVLVNIIVISMLILAAPILHIVNDVGPFLWLIPYLVLIGVIAGVYSLPNKQSWDSGMLGIGLNLLLLFLIFCLYSALITISD